MVEARSDGPRGSTLPYTLVATVIGALAGWVPALLHGPIPAKFDALYINGSIAVWSYYSARMLIGFLVGITTWPRRWYLRGPLCGLLIVFPITMISLAMPGCGAPCMRWNLFTAACVGTTVAGLTFWITGRDHR